MESLCIPEVTDSEISGLGLSVAGLKELCCIYN